MIRRGSARIAARAWARPALRFAALLGFALLTLVAYAPVQAADPVQAASPHAASLHAASAIVPTTPEDFKLPGTLPNSLTEPLISASNCTACHVEKITTNWAGTMMANSARDPLFRAALQVANEDAAGGGELCIRCHVPNAWLNGRSTPTDGSAFVAQDMQGVTCTVCHRLVAGSAVDGESTRDKDERDHIKTSQNTLLYRGSAAYVIDRQDYRRGPYPAAAPHGASQSSYLRTAELCATCHEIDNPTLTWDDAKQEFALNELNKAGGFAKHFPVERTYSEWLYSAFSTNLAENPDGGGVAELSSLYPGLKRATGTADGPITVCQDCHMPMFNEPIVLGGGAKNMGYHAWAGGSARWQDAVVDFWDDIAGDTSFDQTAEDATTAAKQKGAALLGVAATLELTRTAGVLEVKIVNNTGHKLPTGYAEGRRMWLQVTATQEGTPLRVWGKPLADGAIEDIDGVKVYEIKLGLTDAHAQDIGRPDLAGEGFHFILNNQVVKDNRIPPRGFKNAVFATRSMAPVGYSYADGQYWDTTAYALPAGADKVDVTLWFQAASDEYLDFLEQEANDPVPDAIVGQPVNWGQVVGSLRDQYGLDEPVEMASASLTIPGGVPAYVYLPLVERP
jgi:hypothetical protein